MKKGSFIWYKKLEHQEKVILWWFVGAILLAMVLMVLISTMREYDSDLSLQQCNQLRVDDVSFALGVQEENNVLAFFYAFNYPFKFLIIAIGLGWILHGVGFKVIGQ